ncbi:MAG TPA: MarR family transcriptional regulator [Actinomycetota bacterium]|nr:MarR family transcriptional regulator [Actinomycetota bacterium]
MSTKLSDLELEAWQAFLHAHAKVTQLLDADLRRGHGLTWSQYDVLVRLARAPGGTLRMSDLAERVMISPSGLTRAVDDLVSEGLVERHRGGKDARVVFASLTGDGRERVRRAARDHLRGINEHFTGKLTKAQLRNVASALQAIAGPHEPH